MKEEVDLCQGKGRCEMPKRYQDLVAEARREVPQISAQEVRQKVIRGDDFACGIGPHLKRGRRAGRLARHHWRHPSDRGDQVDPRHRHFSIGEPPDLRCVGGELPGGQVRCQSGSSPLRNSPHHFGPFFAARIRADHLFANLTRSLKEKPPPSWI